MRRHLSRLLRAPRTAVAGIGLFISGLYWIPWSPDAAGFLFLLAGAFILMPVFLPIPAALVEQTLQGYIRMVTVILGSCTTAAVVGLMFLLGRLGPAFAPLQKAGDWDIATDTLGPLFWTVGAGACGFLALVLFAFLQWPSTQVRTVQNLRQATANIAMTAAITVPITLWAAVVQLATTWTGVELWLLFQNSGS